MMGYLILKYCILTIHTYLNTDSYYTITNHWRNKVETQSIRRGSELTRVPASCAAVPRGPWELRLVSQGLILPGLWHFDTGYISPSWDGERTMLTHNAASLPTHSSFHGCIHDPIFPLKAKENPSSIGQWASWPQWSVCLQGGLIVLWQIK